jgi:hypothetical protein
MSELKTLKDLKHQDWEEEDYFYLDPKEVKKETIKWVKEDRELIAQAKDMPKSVKILMNYLCSKWMRRLNITEKDLIEEDLKDE